MYGIFGINWKQVGQWDGEVMEAGHQQRHLSRNPVLFQLTMGLPLNQDVPQAPPSLG